MRPSRAGTIARNALAPLLLAPLLLAPLGCDALTVNAFSGAIMQFTVKNAAITATGTHLELWARDANNDIVRLTPYYQENKFLTVPGLVIKPAVTLDDPCMTDGQGHLLTSSEAYPSSVTVAGVTQTPLSQAQQVINHINQLNPEGLAQLLAVLPYSSVPDLVIPDGTAPADRQKMCDAAAAADPNFYIAQPSQVTTPIHGAVYGFIRFQTTTPPADYDGFRLDVPVNLRNVQELYFTTESVPIDQVDPKNPGPLFMDSQPAEGGRDILQFTLRSAVNGGPSGAVAVEDTLDQDPVQF